MSSFNEWLSQRDETLFSELFGPEMPHTYDPDTDPKDRSRPPAPPAVKGPYVELSMHDDKDINARKLGLTSSAEDLILLEKPMRAIDLIGRDVGEWFRRIDSNGGIYSLKDLKYQILNSFRGKTTKYGGIGEEAPTQVTNAFNLALGNIARMHGVIMQDINGTPVAMSLKYAQSKGTRFKDSPLGIKQDPGKMEKLAGAREEIAAANRIKNLVGRKAMREPLTF